MANGPVNIWKHIHSYKSSVKAKLKSQCTAIKIGIFFLMTCVGEFLDQLEFSVKK